MATRHPSRLWGLALLLGFVTVNAQVVESEPARKFSDFPGVPAATGPGYRVDAEVPVSGFLGQFTLRADDGVFKADGVEQLQLRVAELPALAALNQLSSSEVFVDALGKSAGRTAQAVGRAVTSPVETVKGIPAGVGRFFSSAGKTVQQAAEGGSASSTGEAAKDAIGINKAKRGIAKQVGLDPYTSNPVAAERLDDLATAAFAGGVSLDVALAVGSGGLSTAISVTKTMSNLVWELPPADIRARNEKSLATLGVAPETTRSLLNNRYYTPTLALAFVDELGKLGVKKGVDAFAALAASADSETEARFFIAQLRMARSYAASGNRIAAIETPRSIGLFRTTAGHVFVPAPLDYVAWTADVQRFAASKDVGAGTPVVWLTGTLSPTAAKGFAAKGWTVRERASRG